MYQLSLIIIIIIILPRYSVPEDLEITNKENNYNGCNGLAGSERALKRDRVPPLQCYGHLLEHVGGLSLVTCDVCRPSSNLLDQFDGLTVPGSGRFDDYWIKMWVLVKRLYLLAIIIIITNKLLASMKANLLKRLNVTNVIFSGCAHSKCALDGDCIKALYRH